MKRRARRRRNLLAKQVRSSPEFRMKVKQGETYKRLSKKDILLDMDESDE